MQIKMFNALLIMDPAVTLLIHYVGDRYSGGGVLTIPLKEGEDYLCII